MDAVAEAPSPPYARQLEGRVAQHRIASYLGISPEFLSKVKKKLERKE